MATIKYTDAEGKTVEVPADKIDWDSLDLSDYTGDVSIDSLPGKWKRDIVKLRRDAAKVRVEGKEPPKDNEGDRPATDNNDSRYADLAKRNSEMARELARERLMRKHKLSDDEADLLRGETPEDLANSAEALVRVLGARGGKTEDKPKGDKPEGDDNASDAAGPADSKPKPRLRGNGEDSNTEGFDPAKTVSDIIAARGGF